MTSNIFTLAKIFLVVVLLLFAVTLSYNIYTPISFYYPLTDTFAEKRFDGKNDEITDGRNKSNIDLKPADVEDNEAINIKNSTSAVQNIGTAHELLPQTVLKKSLDGNPVILMWRAQWGNAPTKPEINPNMCEENITCDFTSNRQMLEKAGAVVFHFTALESAVPKIRKPHQLYVYWSSENPANTKRINHNIKNYFNVTMSYRRDSDIYFPYSSLHETLRLISEDMQPDLDGLLALKRQSGKMAVWVVSNCKITQRMDLATGLEKNGVKVDKFGKCFNRELGKGHPRHSTDLNGIISKYKFYFSFENTYHCKDYITEKFWRNGFRGGTVPVVWGAKKEDILRVAPLKSFIHFDDFESVKELAEYLKYLSSNETAYVEYLQWRTWIQNPNLIEAHLQEEMELNHLRGFCKLCGMLHENRRNISIGNSRKWKVTSLQDYWVGRENKDCLEMDKTKHL